MTAQCPAICADYGPAYQCEESAGHPGDHYVWVTTTHIVTWTGEIDELRRV